ncbi:hypothetical protein [Campylobacter geochelonis]|uniref:hypothetical protein n=1 Tax=Campylobacter geochelonis TaxID=1780362 RepID=UPI000770AD53|nr:hypothetical protein [Campylobacter geochelonis]CZE47403.1 Uncharacterised protein [Campylobacter geochelonis]
MKHIVAIVKSISGNIVKKDFETSTEDQLHQWDLVKLDDYIWARSLDAKAVIVLRSGELVLKAGMRIKFDAKFLEGYSKDFYLDQDDIDKIMPKAQDADSLADDDLKQSKSFISKDLSNVSINEALEANISVFSGNELVAPAIKSGYNIYECKFDSVEIKISATKEANSANLYSFDMANLLDSKDMDDDASVSFYLQDLDENLNLGYCVVVYRGKEEIFKTQFIIFVNENAKHLSYQKDKSIGKIELALNYAKDEDFAEENVIINIDTLGKKVQDMDIDYLFKVNKAHPAFKFSSKEDVVVKSYLMGISGCIFDEPQELKGILRKEDDGYYYIFTNKFQVPESYLIYINFLSKSSKSVLDEIFCKFDIKFKNTNLLKIEKIKDGFLYGYGAGVNSEVLLYSMDSQNNFRKITSVYSDASGKFNFDINSFQKHIFNGRIVIQEIDAYNNKSIAVGIEI